MTPKPAAAILPSRNEAAIIAAVTAAAAGTYPTAELVVSALPPGATDGLAPLWTPAAGTLMDVVHQPWPTRFACAAEAAGRRVVGGLPMLVHQAAQQVVPQNRCPRVPHAEMLKACRSRAHTR
ncbi:hypothetical protein ACGF8B_11840 [Streptomyces sp. NPDC047917]|uniref:hypothetical protein n=1 Tax=Streptomyces sp. NPDC047917 TaxID=3365491 RepID=UPI0037213CF5